jgi:hypothetical protein
MGQLLLVTKRWKSIWQQRYPAGPGSGAIGYANGHATLVGATENAGPANNESSGANGHQGGHWLAGTLPASWWGQPSQASPSATESGLNFAGYGPAKGIFGGARGSAGYCYVAGTDARGKHCQPSAERVYTQGGMCVKSQDMTQGRGCFGPCFDSSSSRTPSVLVRANEPGQAG